MKNSLFGSMLKKPLFVILLSFCCIAVQANFLEKLAKSDPVITDAVNREPKNFQYFIATPFAKPIIISPEIKKELEEVIVEKVELVYTRFRTSPSFNQEQLNINRLKELDKLLPNLFENPLWEFQLTEQTNGNSREECDKMFHGFILTVRPNANKDYLEQETVYIEQLVSELTKADSINRDVKILDFDIKTRWDNTIGYVHDTIWKKVKPKPVLHPKLFYNPTLYKDSTVIDVFARNDWENALVVVDVTGSMSPYTAQVFLWVQEKIKDKNVKGFVFFNDGDDKPSRRKKPMETKGVYFSKNNTLDSIMFVATRCMRSGSGGGESYENDVEAMAEGLKQFPDVDNVILVADNMESMRDYKFIKELDKPVHAVMCGVRNRIHFQYLDLARQTKGSLHTRDDDFLDLQELRNGEKIVINELEYEFNKGGFHYVY